jgi:putative ABC transport system permease protein
MKATRVVIAWEMLFHKKRRLIVSLMAVMFAVVIMFMQQGFFNGLNDSQAMVPPLFNADLVLMDHRREHMNRWNDLPVNRLAQAAALPEVTEVLPVYNGTFAFKNRLTGQGRRMFVLAFPPDSRALRLPELAALAPRLRVHGTILFDRKSRSIYGPVEPGAQVEMDERQYTVVGLFEMGPNFSNDGAVLMGEGTWLEAVNAATGEMPAWGLVRLRPGTNIAAVQARLRATLPKDTLVLTPEEMRQREVDYTIRAVPIGAIFGIGLIIGFIIGTIICYQILFNEITDHMPQYATLKAMGYSDGFLRRVVLQQALLLSIIGFVPGLLGGFGLYALLYEWTSIVMFQTLGRASLIFLLTVLMCVGAGMIAVKKVLRSDPAEVF